MHGRLVHRASLAQLIAGCHLPRLRLPLLLRVVQRHRIGIEGQHAAKLASDTAYCAAESGIAECAADGLAERLGYVTDQIAEPALGRQLRRCLLCALLSPLQQGQLLHALYFLQLLKLLQLLLLQLLLQLL